MHPRSRHHGRGHDARGQDRHASHEGRARRGRDDQDAGQPEADAPAGDGGARPAQRGGRERQGRRGERGEGQRSPRRLAHGDLRLLLLGLLEAQPRHGYELIQLIGEMFLGQYAPSAGAVYPALAQLQDDGLVTSSEDGARRLHALTEAGRAFVHAHAQALDDARLRTRHSARMLVKAGLPAPVRGGMSAVKRALLAHHGHWTPESGESIARILQQAAAQIAQVSRGD
ncbi:PadR family transcriptional regulator [Pseudoxanthomonas winnipegensis]|jgi:DNA-binding PadR family transcriptional regulator|uniref:PadR family transcriptional regulator n=1 Tax=Pseudoxanthomonas winnipegensis TaxID=2480810 RepID=A0A4Q8L725_9GAMM|nr:PadR family transcriptional regulator [Pseudoxanthomonas winnipegensis]PZP61009.1 MAG: PadR family transcriptional regulator [Pseudoxanthomonas spadix]TAA23298.1 PadR family transcriptional regulator [Pseudoxanthomonas winnipegensis]